MCLGCFSLHPVLNTERLLSARLLYFYEILPLHCWIWTWNNKVDKLDTDPVGKLGIKPYNSKLFQLCLPPQIFGPSTGPILSFWRYVLLLKLPKLGQTILYLNTQWTIFSMIVQKTQAICNYQVRSCYRCKKIHSSSNFWHGSKSVITFGLIKILTHLANQ